MTPEAKQGLAGCAILALGFLFTAEIPIMPTVVLDPSAFLRVAGSVILADYGLGQILEAWKGRRRP